MERVKLILEIKGLFEKDLDKYLLGMDTRNAILLKYMAYIEELRENKDTALKELKEFIFKNYQHNQDLLFILKYTDKYAPKIISQEYDELTQLELEQLLFFLNISLGTATTSEKIIKTAVAKVIDGESGNWWCQFLNVTFIVLELRNIGTVLVKSCSDEVYKPPFNVHEFPIKAVQFGTAYGYRWEIFQHIKWK